MYFFPFKIQAAKAITAYTHIRTAHHARIIFSLLPISRGDACNDTGKNRFFFSFFTFIPSSPILRYTVYIYVYIEDSFFAHTIRQVPLRPPCAYHHHESPPSR